MYQHSSPTTVPQVPSHNISHSNAHSNTTAAATAMYLSSGVAHIQDHTPTFASHKNCHSTMDSRTSTHSVPTTRQALTSTQHGITAASLRESAIRSANDLVPTIKHKTVACHFTTGTSSSCASTNTFLTPSMTSCSTLDYAPPTPLEAAMPLASSDMRNRSLLSYGATACAASSESPMAITLETISHSFETERPTLRTSTQLTPSESFGVIKQDSVAVHRSCVTRVPPSAPLPSDSGWATRIPKSSSTSAAFHC